MWHSFKQSIEYGRKRIHLTLVEEANVILLHSLAYCKQFSVSFYFCTFSGLFPWLSLLTLLLKFYFVSHVFNHIELFLVCFFPIAFCSSFKDVFIF